MIRVARRIWTVTMVSLLAGAPVAAQDAGAARTRGLAFDTVVGIQDFFLDNGAARTAIIIDTLTTAEVRSGTQVAFRPKLWRKDGTWLTLVDQLSVRHEFRGGLNWRIEAGRFPSPIGLGMTENRASTNGALYWCHRPLYVPLPSQSGDDTRLALNAAVYPNGAQVTTSGARWDARVAVIDTAPVQFWHPQPTASRTLNTVVGGGVTPTQGLRLGGGVARGTVGHTLPGRPDQRYVMLNAEGEYAFGYTRLSGEWTRDRFTTVAGRRIADGWTLQAQHTLSPRVFVHTRVSTIHAPLSPTPTATVAAPAMGRFRSVDSTVGYLLSPDLTLRVGHSAVRTWSAGAADHRVGLSIMWARRWW